MTLYSRKRGLVSRFDSVNRVYSLQRNPLQLFLENYLGLLTTQSSSCIYCIRPILRSAIDIVRCLLSFVTWPPISLESLQSPRIYSTSLQSFPVSRFECVSGLSVYWPIIALGSHECGVAKLCRDPTVQSEFFLRVSLLKTLILIEFIAVDS